MQFLCQLMGKCSSLPTNIREKFPPSGHVRKSYLVDLLIDPFKELLSNNFWTEKTLTTPVFPRVVLSPFFGTQKGFCEVMSEMSLTNDGPFVCLLWVFWNFWI